MGLAFDPVAEQHGREIVGYDAGPSLKAVACVSAMCAECVCWVGGASPVGACGLLCGVGAMTGVSRHS